MMKEYIFISSPFDASGPLYFSSCRWGWYRPMYRARRSEPDQEWKLERECGQIRVERSRARAQAREREGKGVVA